MAVIEGQGMAAPNPIKVAIKQAEIRHLELIASQRNKHRGYTRSNSSWKRGSIDNPILMGLVGEYAFQLFLKGRGITASVVDDSLNDGDGGKDAVIAGVTYQVKTSGKLFKTLLVRRINESKTLVPHVCDRFVFCKWSPGDKFCLIRGWCEREAVTTRGTIKQGKTGKWRNNELDDRYLLNMQSLALLIKQEIDNV